MTDTHDLLTVSQAADALSSSGQTIRNWIREGRLDGLRVGHRFLIPRREVERLRGSLPAPEGESPWAFDLGEREVSLRRAAPIDADRDSSEEALGG